MSPALRARFASLCVLASIAASIAAPRAARAEEENAWRAEGRAAIARARALEADSSKQAKNLILFVGDGMGMSTITAARIFDGQRRGKLGEENALAFESFPYVALSKTYSVERAGCRVRRDDDARLVTGVKTTSRRDRLDETACRATSRASSAAAHETLARASRSARPRDGDRHHHAHHPRDARRLLRPRPAPRLGRRLDAPAPTRARRASRTSRASSSSSRIGDGIDVALGGGRAQFLPERRARSRASRRRTARAATAAISSRPGSARHPQGRCVWNRAQFVALDAGTAVPCSASSSRRTCTSSSSAREDAAGEPSLAEMTAKAIELLARNPRRLLPDGRRRPHRSRPPLRQRLPRARRDGGVLERRARRARAGRIRTRRCSS